MFTAGNGCKSVVNSASPDIMNLCDKIPQKILFNSKDSIWHDKQHIYFEDKRLFPTSILSIPGTHNLSNLCAALTVLNELGIDISGLAEIISSFKGLPHRLETVAVQNNIRFVNDSIATVSEATIAALEAFPAEPTVLIIGGQEKDQDWSSLSSYIAKHPPMAVVGLPDSGKRMLEEIKQKAFDSKSPELNLFPAEDMEHAVRIATETLSGSGIVLLSPGTPSYGHYRNFEDRGEHFRKIACLSKKQ